MKFLSILVIAILLSSCSNSTKDEIYISKAIEIVDHRINFIVYSLSESKNLNPNSRRFKFLHQKTEDINLQFIIFQHKLLKGKKVEDEKRILKDIVIQISESMDANGELIERMIEEKFNVHLNELDNLSLLSINEMSDLEIIHSMKTIQEGLLNTIFTLSRTDKYTFEKLEPLVIPINHKNSKMKEGDSLKIFIGQFAYDTTYYPKNIYWIDDSSGNELNALKSESFYIWVKGDKGKHIVRGKTQTFPHNREHYKLWELHYIVE